MKRLMVLSYLIAASIATVIACHQERPIEYGTALELCLRLSDARADYDKCRAHAADDFGRVYDAGSDR